ncbi:hypothetical protein FGO68_gene9042 [Halteria grandinella]|uniref:Uncharacterized protein n=1 Tax=Halteria grandinella TaxID=5974 RepID=A0A8J8NUJ0_HALGN|nr:hypothetical protein FGO68_gene9042 [Halteria grandinella]
MTPQLFLVFPQQLNNYPSRGSIEVCKSRSAQLASTLNLLFIERGSTAGVMRHQCHCLLVTLIISERVEGNYRIATFPPNINIAKSGNSRSASVSSQALFLEEAEICLSFGTAARAY